MPSGGRETAEMKAEAEAKDEAKSKRQITTFRVCGSEFTKLETYILGSSGAVITNVGLIGRIGFGLEEMLT